VVNLITSMLAAGIATSEVFRVRFGEDTGYARAPAWGGEIFEGATLEPGVPETLDFHNQTIALFGCGSIAFAAFHSLRSVRHFSGTMAFVDPSRMSRSNVRKYLGISGDELRERKSALLARIWRSHGFRAEAFDIPVNAYGRRTGFNIPIAISAVDSSIARRDIQAKLPRIVLNAWTGGSDDILFAGTSRHSFDGAEECLNCAYWNDTEGMLSNLVDIAQRTGSDSSTLSRKRRDGHEFPPLRGLPAVRDRRYLDGYYNACERWSVQRGTVERNFSVPFNAAIAGALLASALVAEGSAPFAAARSHGVRRNFAMAPTFTALFSEPASAREGCICQEPAYRTAYGEKWGGA
jgi:hypothetical protein